MERPSDVIASVCAAPGIDHMYIHVITSNIVGIMYRCQFGIVPTLSTLCSEMLNSVKATSYLGGGGKVQKPVQGPLV